MGTSPASVIWVRARETPTTLSCLFRVILAPSFCEVVIGYLKVVLGGGEDGVTNPFADNNGRRIGLSVPFPGCCGGSETVSARTTSPRAEGCDPAGPQVDVRLSCVELNDFTNYNGGTVTVNSVLQQDGNVSVNSANTIDGDYFDMDGSSEILSDWNRYYFRTTYASPVV